MKRFILGLWLLSCVAAPALPGTLPIDWRYLGLAGDVSACEFQAREAGLAHSRLGGYWQGAYYANACFGGDSQIVTGALTGLAQSALDTVTALRPLVDPGQDYLRYLLPIKVSAERAVAIARVDGPSSVRSLTAVVELRAVIENAEPFLDSLLRREDAAAPLAEQLISIHEQIENQLH